MKKYAARFAWGENLANYSEKGTSNFSIETKAETLTDALEKAKEFSLHLGKFVGELVEVTLIELQ